MLWFKHFCDASSGEFISFLESQFGLEGYARWFKLLEKIGSRMDKSDLCEATLPIKLWCSYLVVRRPLLLRYLSVIEQQGKIETITNGQLLTIRIPKMLEIKDEYSKKSGHSSDSCQENVHHKNKEVRDKIQKKKKEQIQKPVFIEQPMNEITFDDFWKVWPKRKAKSPALKSWNKINPKEYPKIIEAVKAQIKSGDLNIREMQFCPLPTTWLNQGRWTDEIVARAPQINISPPRRSQDGWLIYPPDGGKRNLCSKHKISMPMGQKCPECLEDKNDQ